MTRPPDDPWGTALCWVIRLLFLAFVLMSAGSLAGHLIEKRIECGSMMCK